MLLELADLLRGWYSGFHLFQYLTFRAIMSTLTALAVSLLVGPAVIRKLADVKAGQVIRWDGPQTHLVKAGTPTMGGLLILLAVAIATLLWADLRNATSGSCSASRWPSAAIGFYDDYKKLVLRDSRGLASRWKYFWQSVFGLAVAVILYSRRRPAGAYRALPAGVQDRRHSARPAVHPAGLSHDRRLLQRGEPDRWPRRPRDHAERAGGRPRSASSPTWPAMRCSRATCGSPRSRVRANWSIFCGALAGAGLGFLWFNTYPAQVFMGDIGALAVGGALGTIAVIVRQEIVLLIMGGMFVLETASVMLQVASFKLTGRRIFRMAPIHHHFELKGWPEPRVIVRFWIISVVLVLVGLATLKVR